MEVGGSIRRWGGDPKQPRSLRYKAYMNRNGFPLEDLRAPAAAANREIFSGIANLQAITRYVEKGLFPWEPSAVAR
jgi:polyketide biosynthesis enoyl-CoA hydratase PksH